MKTKIHKLTSLPIFPTSSLEKNTEQSYIKTRDGIQLYCPQPWNELGWPDINFFGNGCGVNNGWKIDLVPDAILGCYIGEACNIHDLMYHMGTTSKDKYLADYTFLNNIIRLINGRTTNWVAKIFLKSIRKHLGYTYYIAVQKFGDPAFWNKR